MFRALNRSKQMMCKEIQDQMKKIINQGEIIRKHLETMKVNNYLSFCGKNFPTDPFFTGF